MIIMSSNRKLRQRYKEKWIIVKKMHLLDKGKDTIGKSFYGFVSEEEKEDECQGSK